jgi:hypothetical protein
MLVWKTYKSKISRIEQKINSLFSANMIILKIIKLPNK